MEINKNIVISTIMVLVFMVCIISSVVYITITIRDGITSGKYKRIIIEKTADIVKFFSNLKKEIDKNLLYRREREESVEGNINEQKYLFLANIFLSNTTISHRYY